MTAQLPVTAAVTPEFVAALNQNFAAIDAKLDQLLGLWVTVATDCNAVAGNCINADTSNGSFTVTLPSDPAEGDRVNLNDFAGTWATNALFVDPNGNEFEDAGDGSESDQPMICDAPAQFSIVFAAGFYRIR